MDAARFAAELDTHRRYLLRVAQLQLRDGDLAEDVVQETLLAALAAQAGFTGKSSVKTWLTGILKHKIVDAIRRKQRQPIFAASFDEETDLDEFDPMFKDNGALGSAARRLGRPGERAVAAAVLRRDGVLPRKAAAEYRPRLHDARGDGARIRRNL